MVTQAIDRESPVRAVTQLLALQLGHLLLEPASQLQQDHCEPPHGQACMQGSIVRTVRRCEELLRQLIDAAKVIGEHDLAEQFGLCVESIKRDIVFAASLYL